MAAPRWIKWGYGRLRRSPNPVHEESVEDTFKRAVAFDVGSDGTVDKEKAAALYRQAVEKGHVTAMYALANLLVDGTLGVPRDTDAAIELYERAIDEGTDPDAMFRLGRLLWEGSNGVEKDSERGLNLLKRSAELGSASAMTVVGVLKLHGGDGVLKDTEEAVELLTRAVEECEDPIAMERLACVYRDGAGTIEVDTKRAVELYERSINKSGNTEAMRGLGILYCDGGEGVAKDVGRGAEMFECAIREGENTKAMVDLGNLLSSDDEDIPRDVPRAVELYKRAVYLGNEEDAICKLAHWWCEGHEGVEKDIDEALRMLRHAVSENSSFKAMGQLGRVLTCGFYGVKEDPEAVNLLVRAAHEGQNPVAMHMLGALTCAGNFGLVADGSRGIEMLEEAANRGEYGALITLGNFFNMGSAGVVQDQEMAIETFTRSIEEHNDDGAKYNLSRLLWEKENVTEEDRIRMWELLERGVEEKLAACMNMMGVMLMSGKHGKQRDLKRAKHVLQSAMKLETSKLPSKYIPFNLGVLYYDHLPRTPHNVQRAAHFFELSLKQATPEDGPYGSTHRYLAELLWRGKYGIRPNPSRAVRLLKRAIEAEQEASDVKLLAKWVLSGRGGTEGDLDYVRKLLRQTIEECSDPRKRSDLRHLLDKCDRTTMISIQNGEVRVSAGKGTTKVS